ncbi:MAG TPA: HIT family protein [Fimbriimonas sp.]
MSGCLICRYVDECRTGRSERFVYEFEHSVLTVGEHQFFEGYCVLLLKEHVRDLHELAQPVRRAFFDETMAATEAIVKAYQPWKMNHASYGNAQPHLHWHLFPRYEDDPDRTANPWTHQDRFALHTTSTEAAAKVRDRLLPYLG